MEVLSQAEIEQLLTAINAGEHEPKRSGPATDSRKIRIYDYKRPAKFFKEHIRTISIIFENFCRLTTVSLSAQIRSMCRLHVASVDELTYEEFIRIVPTPTTLAIINMSPLKGNALLEICPDITSSIIDRICGGFGRVSEIREFRHELTDIENYHTYIG